MVQALAGQNPLSIRAATTVDLKATLVKDADVKNLMEGKTLEEARKASLLWVLDYTEPYKAFMQRVEDMNSSSVQYSGRCFLYTRSACLTAVIKFSLIKANNLPSSPNTMDHSAGPTV